MRSCLFILLFTLLLKNNAASQLKAAFTADNTNACAPVITKFTDASSGNPTQWKWDLGNGTVSTEQNPSTIYFNPGNYTVKLVVTNNSGTDSIVKTNYIVVDNKPVADFTASPASGCSPLPVQFTDGSSAGSGTLTSWSWDFGDGYTDTAKNPLHTYTVGNTFGVILTVKNNFGCKQTLQKSNFINVSAPVAAKFSYNYTNACQPPTLVTFVNTSSPAGSLSYQWIFGDGQTSTQTSPVYTYDSSGDYLIQLVATNEKGCTDTFSQKISIGSVRPDFTFNNSCVNQQISFTNISTPEALSVKWSFGDNTAAVTTINATHQYTLSGTYQVTMTADFGSCTVSKTKLITVTNKPSIGFTATGGVAQCAVPSSVIFVNTTTGASSYQWLFGDSTTDVNTSPSHTYNKAGVYDVTLIASGTGGCSDTLVQKKLINLGPPKISSIQNLPYSGCIGDNIKMTPVISSPETIQSYAWDFGDGSASADPIPIHNYTDPGNYTVKLTVTTTGGCTATFSSTATMTAVPVAKFTQTPLNACASVPIQFTDQSTGTITSWLWNFGDKTSSTLQNPSHYFASTGKFIVTLTISNNGCKSVYIGDTLTIYPPIASFSVINQCQFQFIKGFTNTSLGAVTQIWDFGDGQTDVSVSPTHTYASTGNYKVSLTVTNGTCSSTLIKTVPVVKQNPSISYIPANPVFCKYSKIQLQVTNYDPSVVSSFYWNFGDNSTAPFDPANSTVSHQYTQSGVYSPQLIMRDTLGCKDTVSGTIAFTVYGPTAAFSPNITGACLKTSVQFTDNSTTDGTHNIVKWVWDYGDGTTESLSGPPFQHTYDRSDTFTIQLTVTDSYGCTDSLSKQKILVIAQPHADFSLSDSLRCSANNITFTNLSTGSSFGSSWDFGDGNTSAEKNPVAAYTNQGVYSVKLKITDQYGCTDSITKQNIITISNPVASFNLADTFATCPPLFVQPQNTSRNYEAGSVLWQFGDGNTSNLLNPLHNYINGGTYQLTLIVTGYGQCNDTASKTVILHGPSGILNYPNVAGCAPATITVSAVIRNSQYRTWDFGDGVVITNTDSTITHTYTSYGLYQPKLLLSDTAGCLLTVLNPDTVHVSGISAGIASAQQTSCDSSLINFTDSSQVYYDKATAYKWDFGDNSSGADTSTLPNPGHYYLHSGNYSVSHVVQSQLGCTDSVTTILAVVVHAGPRVLISGVDTACQLSPVQFSARDTAAASTTVTSWQWDFGTGGTDVIQQPVYKFPASGTFNVQVAATNADGCINTSSHLITIIPVPLTDAGPDITLCSGQSVTLQATGADSYVWVSQPSLSCDHCATPVASPSSTIEYYVTGTSSGCQTTDSILVKVKEPFVLTISPPDSLCAGESVQLHTSGGEVYQWQPATGLSDPSIANPIATPATTTTYTLIASDDSKCFADTGQVTISVFPQPVFTIPDSSISVLAGFPDTIRTIGSPDIIRWEWSPATWLSCYDCAEPVTQPNNNITYTATVYTSAGCTVSRQVIVRVLCSGANVYIPNTFSPNGNNMNERFYPRGRGLFGIASFKVFDRNGSVVFERREVTPNNAADGWDGTYKGRPAPTGVYVYIMDVTCENNTVLNLKGNVTLIR